MPYLIEKYNKNQSLAARELLGRLLRKYKIPFSGEIPRIKDHLHIENFPNCKVSLSHTRSFVAAAIEKKSKIASIGIDIENQNRPVKEGIEKFYRSSQDDFSLSSLELWTLKEAAYKALFPLLKDEKLTLKKIWIRNEHFGTKEKTWGKVKKETLKIEGETLIISRAFTAKF